MKRLWRSVAYRIAIVSVLGFMLAALSVGLVGFYATHGAMQREMDKAIEQASMALLAEYADHGVEGVRHLLHERQERGPNALGYALFTPEGTRVAGALDTPMPQPGWQRIVFLDPVEGPDPARAKVTRMADGNLLVVATDLEPLEKIDRELETIFGLGLVVVVVLGVIGGMVLGVYLRSRLVQIEETANAIVAGDLTRRMTVSVRADEFDAVGASLNAMLDRIADLIVNLRQVSGDLAHDLRTPLMRLRNHIDQLRGADVETREDMIEGAVERVDEVLRLFEVILRISELEEGSLRRSFAPVDLAALLGELAETHQPLGEDAGIVIRTESAAVSLPMIAGDRELLAQGLINLIENALRHATGATHIALGARVTIGRASQEGDRTLEVYVADDGPGIAEVMREKVFERFVRLETARSTAGHGLGLSLVKAIGAVHGAEVFARDRAGRFEIGFAIALGAQV